MITEHVQFNIGDNIVGAINEGSFLEKEAKEILKFVSKNSAEVAKDVSEEQLDYEMTKEGFKTKDALKAFGTAFYNQVVVKNYNQALLDDISKKYSDKFDDRAVEKKILETLTIKDKEGNISFNNKYNDLFTSEMQERVLGLNNGVNMFDYSYSSGVTDKQIKIDNDILSTLINKDIPDFEVFKIRDLEGNVLHADKYSSTIINFLESTICESHITKGDGIKIGHAVNDVFNTQKKMLKAHKSKAFRNLCTACLDTSNLEHDLKVYKDQFKPVGVAIKSAGVVKKSAEITTKVGVNVAKKIAVGAAMGPQAKLALNKKFGKVESAVDKVYHPVKNLKEGVVKKASGALSNSGLYSKLKDSLGRIATRYKEKKAVKLASGIHRGIGKAFYTLNLPFRMASKYIVNAIRKVIIVTSCTVVPFVIIMLFICANTANNMSAASSPIVFPLGNLSDFKLWQYKYNELDEKFLQELEYEANSYAENTNLKGENIVYGVNGLNNEEGMKNNDYKNGLSYKYITDSEHDGRTSNIDDLISIMALMFSQNQSNYMDQSLECFTWLYNLSHNFTMRETPLYACDSGCHNIAYKCTDVFNDYIGEDIKYNPFHAAVNSGGDYEIFLPTDKCEACDDYSRHISDDCHVMGITNYTKADYYGCNPLTSLCFHGTHKVVGEQDEDHVITLGTSRPSYCTNCSLQDNPTEYEDKDGNVHITHHYFYQCDGHTHYDCTGHNYKCCMGHTNLKININVKYADEIKDTIDDLDFGTYDKLSEAKNKYENYEEHINITKYVKKEDDEE